MNRYSLNGAWATMVRSTPSQGTTSGVATQVIFNSGSQNTSGMIDTVNGDITIPTDGLYLITASVSFNGENTPIVSSYRWLQIYVNGSVISSGAALRANDGVNSDTLLSDSNVWACSVGDVVTVSVAQNSGENGVSPFGATNGPFINQTANTRLTVHQLHGKTI